ncbi:MAG: SDR family NAD(P)-dependent oxidoreductase, partial [candidate division Zixibacteria bacterium]|nr:SDR family NAD(P)-dependent oxidoreductase [candidate division Zixibacteria bacterium]
MQSMAGKVTLVTGASRGIGRAIALCFAKNKSKLVVSARNKKELEGLVRQIKKEGGEAFALRADMADEAQIKNLVSKTLAHYGAIDIV